LLAAARRLGDLARAAPLAPGRYALALTGPALTEPPGAEFGWFAPIVAHADGATARRGLTRYLPGQSIFPDGATSGDPITIASDGALDFGTASEPFGELGEPVRRFELVDRGVAAGLALDLREAGLRDVAPNGGVRNLVVAPGTLAERDELAPGSAPLLQLVALRALDTDLGSGAFAAAVELAYLDGAPVTGGLVRGNVYDLLAGARLSAATEFHGWYRGPRAIRTGATEVW